MTKEALMKVQEVCKEFEYSIAVPCWDTEQGELPGLVIGHKDFVDTVVERAETEDAGFVCMRQGNEH